MAASEQLTNRQQAALLALLDSPTIVEAANQAKVNERTIRKWLNDDEDFITEYRRLRRRAFDNGFAKLQAIALKAALTLEEALDGNDTVVKLRAANLVFTHLLRAHEMLEIDERLETIEQALEEDRSFRRRGQL